MRFLGLYCAVNTTITSSDDSSVVITSSVVHFLNLFQNVQFVFIYTLLLVLICNINMGSYRYTKYYWH